jgi:hypothetical protein
MRVDARQGGKLVPTMAELESALEALVNMACPLCGRTMNWRQSDGVSTVVSLQHDRESPTVRLLCLGCNVRHASMPGDSLYSLMDGFKRCCDCARTLPVERFPGDSSRPCGRRSYCKACANARHVEWASRNRERLNAEQRARRRAPIAPVSAGSTP